MKKKNYMYCISICWSFRDWVIFLHIVPGTVLQNLFSPRFLPSGYTAQIHMDLHFYCKVYILPQHEAWCVAVFDLRNFHWYHSYKWLSELLISWWNACVAFHSTVSMNPVTLSRTCNLQKDCFVDRALCHSNDEHHILLSWLMGLKSPERACFFDVVKIRETQMITIHWPNGASGNSSYQNQPPGYVFIERFAVANGVWYLNGLADTSHMVHRLPEAFAWLNCPNMQLFSTLVSYTSV